MEHLLLASITDTITGLIKGWYENVGYLGIVLAMAIESCCIPLPSEIVMPLAGIYIVAPAAKAGPASLIAALMGVALAGAVGCLIGSIVAYGIGRAGGRPLLLKYGRYVLISQADSDRADRWFTRFGPPVAFFSRLLPVIRTYISLPAGIYRMNFVKFCLYTVLGSLPWCLLLAFVGYQLGSLSNIEKLATPFRGADIVILVVIVALAVLYIYRHVKHDRAARAALAARQVQTNPRPGMPRREDGMQGQMSRRAPGMPGEAPEAWNQDGRDQGNRPQDQSYSNNRRMSDDQGRKLPDSQGRARPR